MSAAVEARECPAQESMASMPLVSCIMPTRNRRPFVGQAVWYFLRQDYPCKELIILDDGEDAVADLVPQDERIRYVRLEPRLSLGAKRNAACEMSRGDLIAHWDDDDWQAPHRLSAQVERLLTTGADLCGARELLHYQLQEGRGWLYRYPAGGRPWLAGCTLLYRRAAWAKHPFPDRSVAEDSEFVWSFPPDRLQAIPDLALYVALIHGANTGAKNLSGPRWERRSLDDINRLWLLDREFYIGLRNGPRPLQGAPPRSTGHSLTVGAQFSVHSGYGSMAEYLVLGLARAGAMVNILPLALDRTGLSQEFCEVLARARPEVGSPVVYFSWPGAEFSRFQSVPELFINTMWESSRLPAGWAELFNRARALIVPTSFVAAVCRESGVTVPIFVIPEGVDPAVYHYEERPERPGLTTLTIGPIDNRKHVPVAIAAWKEAFPHDPEARLIIKTQYNYQNYVPDDPRVHYVDRVEHTRGIAHWYRQADVLLALGNEGFGLPLVEGMATGLPVIALDSEGQADVCQVAGDCLLPVEPARWEAHDTAFGRCGVRAVPDAKDVAARLRWIAAHRAEARAMGRSASAWAIANRSVWAKGPAVLDVMERYLQPARPLRRLRTLWVPSWGMSCGIAEYTAYLAAELPSVRVTAEPPDLRGVRLLHIQHEPSLFSEVALSSCIQEARLRQVPCVVTEHAVTSQASTWEREATALVAHTDRGVSLLNKRWPGKQVHHIPHGCPTWFPPRKSRPGRVVGAFGFLARHKGFWQLLEALRRLPDTELLLFSSVKYPGLDAAWREAMEGLPVRWVRDYLPVEEIARRLAAEADILAFWYAEAFCAVASGALRIGLATGVPVLASRTRWFDDLGEAVYRPGDLVDGIRHLLEDTGLRERTVSAAREFCEENSWPRMARRHLELWRSLETHPSC